MLLLWSCGGGSIDARVELGRLYSSTPLSRLDRLTSLSLSSCSCTTNLLTVTVHVACGVCLISRVQYPH